LYSPIDDLEQVLDVFFLFFLAISSSVLAFNVILVVDIIAGEVYQSTYMGNVKERLWGTINQKQNAFKSWPKLDADLMPRIFHMKNCEFDDIGC
jgi:hypothetical protein